jgi:tetratricopeptide (TPR) repeat protein
MAIKAFFLSTLIIIAGTFNLAMNQVPDRRAQLGSPMGEHTLFGDFEVDESKAGNTKPLLYEVVLYNLGGTPVARQFVSSKGRYRFLNLFNGRYELAVLLENEEIARTRVEIMAPFKNDFRQDLAFAWRPPANASGKSGSVVSADYYKRSTNNEKLFNKAKAATDQKRYDDALVALQELVALDPKDFQAWVELGTIHLFKQNLDESEKAYVRSAAERPTFFLALMNLGRLRVSRKNFEGAIEPLTEAVKIKPGSADANYYLGEAYLQLKKGSKAVSYLYEALKLDPVGRADAHLRLAALYNAAGMKAKAAVEYEEFLKKKPDHPDRKKFEQYIAANKEAVEAKKN